MSDGRLGWTCSVEATCQGCSKAEADSRLLAGILFCYNHPDLLSGWPPWLLQLLFDSTEIIPASYPARPPGLVPFWPGHAIASGGCDLTGLAYFILFLLFCHSAWELLQIKQGLGIFGGGGRKFIERFAAEFGQELGRMRDVGGLVAAAAQGDGRQEGTIGFEEGAIQRDLFGGGEVALGPGKGHY